MRPVDGGVTDTSFSNLGPLLVDGVGDGGSLSDGVPIFLVGEEPSPSLPNLILLNGLSFLEDLVILRMTSVVECGFLRPLPVRRRFVLHGAEVSVSRRGAISGKGKLQS